MLKCKTSSVTVQHFLNFSTNSSSISLIHVLKRKGAMWGKLIKTELKIQQYTCTLPCFLRWALPNLTYAFPVTLLHNQVSSSLNYYSLLLYLYGPFFATSLTFLQLMSLSTFSIRFCQVQLTTAGNSIGSHDLVVSPSP